MSVQGWHFTQHKTRGRDGWRVERVEPPIVLCQHGLHAGSALVALGNAPGPWVSWVELSGEVQWSGSKVAAEVCTRLAGPVDASRVLREFACDCAERALLRERAAGREPGPGSWAAVDVSRRYARGETTPTELAVARDAARAAAWAVAWDAARAAAWAAAWDAAWAVARDAAWEAEREWQEAELDRRLRELVGLEVE